MNKIIIWGHKNNGHTHGHIHSSYFKAFKYMGYETYWFDDNEDVSGFNFDNCIFLTEDQAQHNIPLNKSSKYILHHTKLDKYIEHNLEYINLANYLKWCDDGIDNDGDWVSYTDINGNGKWDAGEKGLSDWNIRLTGYIGTGRDKEIIRKETTSDAQGLYMLDNLPQGRYIIMEKHQKGFVPTSPPVKFVVLGAGENIMNNNFTNMPIRRLIRRKR